MRDSFLDLHNALEGAECTMANVPETRSAKQGIDSVAQWLRNSERMSGLFFVGNGGSASIAGHFANDFSKAAGFRSMCFNDGASLTCLGNDYGFEYVFSQPIEMHGKFGDILFAVSSSGMSENIIKAVDVACEKRMNVVTLSGFGQGNFLRKKGGINFYVPSNRYGTVEVAHMAIMHAILDEVMADDGK